MPAIPQQQPKDDRELPFTIFSLSPELIARIQFELSPMHLMPLLVSCKGMRQLLDSNKDYWEHVAVHLIWQREPHFYRAINVCQLLFPEDNHRQTMELVMQGFRSTLRGYGSETEGGENGKRKEEWDLETEVAYWSKHIDANVETQIRMYLLYQHGEQCHSFHFISVMDCMLLPIKGLARKMAEFKVQAYIPESVDDSDAPTEYKRTKTRALHRWARRFAGTPGLAKETKVQLMRELSECLDTRFIGGRYVGLEVSSVRCVLHWFRWAN